MNPFLNPKTGLPFVKDFLTVPGRLKKFSPKKMKKYRDKAFRKTVAYAYTVPLYYKKYKEAGIHPRDIRGIDDISKLPMISKSDIVDHFPDGIIPKGYNDKTLQVVCTSGSTGKPVSFYVDFQTYATAAVISIRELRFLNLHWRKSRFAHLGNYSTDKADIGFDKGLISKAQSIYSLDNYLQMNAFSPIQDVVKKLDEFQPDLINSYPITFQNLAYLKRKGYGKNINPKVITVGGYVLDEYTQQYVEEAFGCQMLNTYGTAESSANIAFECRKGTWHINHDFFHIEAIDNKGEIVENGKRGHMLYTKMFGKGTPFIRYTGIDDWITIVPEYECDCGLSTPILTHGVEGRMNVSIVLPDGQLFPSASFATLSVVLNGLKTRKVKQFQIVQKKIDEIDILLVIDEDLRDEKPSMDILIKRIKEVYQKKVGPKVAINVREVKEIKSEPGKPSPLVISHVKPEEGFELLKL